MRLVLGSLVSTAGYAVVLAFGDLDGNRPLLAALVPPLWAVCLLVTWWVRRGESRWPRPVLAIVVVAAVAQLPGLLVPPRTSSDAYRYVWDGQVSSPERRPTGTRRSTTGWLPCATPSSSRGSASTAWAT